MPGIVALSSATSRPSQRLSPGVGSPATDAVGHVLLSLGLRGGVDHVRVPVQWAKHLNDDLDDEVDNHLIGELEDGRVSQAQDEQEGA